MWQRKAEIEDLSHNLGLHKFKEKKKGLTCSLIGESEAEFTGLSVLYVFMCRSESVSKSYKTKAGKSSEMYRKNFSLN